MDKNTIKIIFKDIFTDSLEEIILGEIFMMQTCEFVNKTMMSEVKLANIDGKELRRELEILFEDKERREFFMQMLATSIKETSELLNMVTLMLESPEILQNPESKMKICEFLKRHKDIIAGLSKRMEPFL